MTRPTQADQTENLGAHRLNLFIELVTFIEPISPQHFSSFVLQFFD